MLSSNVNRLPMARKQAWRMRAPDRTKSHPTRKTGVMRMSDVASAGRLFATRIERISADRGDDGSTFATITATFMEVKTQLKAWINQHIRKRICTARILGEPWQRLDPKVSPSQRGIPSPSI